METIFSIFENNLVIAIFSSFISSILIQIILLIVNNFYGVEKVRKANTFLIEVLKPYVAERGLPNKSVLNSLVKSVGRKYNVKRDSMHTINNICEELIREVMEDIYIPIDKKYEYIETLQIYINECDDKSDYEPLKKERLLLANMASSENIKIIAILNGAITIIITLFILLTNRAELKFISNLLYDKELLSAVTMLISIIVVAYTFIISKKDKY